MHSAHHQIAHPRSRSPSPCLFQQDSTDDEEEKHRPVATKDGYLRVADTDSGNESQPLDKSNSRSARINEMLHHSQPVDSLVTLRPASPDADMAAKELLIRPRRSQSSGEMEDMAGGVRTYGAITDNTPNLQVNSNDSITTEDTANLERSATASPRLRRQKSYFTPSMVDELRKRNKLYFLDPITKLKHFHGFPWKLTLQLLKLVLITVQVVMFGGQRESMVEYFERSDLTFKHLLLEGWDPSYETMPYPPATGQYALYSMAELFDHMNNVQEKYYQLPERALTSIELIKDKQTGTIEPIELCFKANSFTEFSNGSYIVSAQLLHNCTKIEPYGPNKTSDIERYLEETGFKLPFNRTLDITLKFDVSTFHLNLLETHYGPTCYMLSLQVVYTNSDRSGQILVDIDTTRNEIDCVGKILSPEIQEEMDDMRMRSITYDACVMGACALSIILCTRSLLRCNRLRKDTARYFKLQRGRPFSFSNHMEYINMWYIIIILNDILTIIGSALKIQLESRVFSISSENYELCSIVLGMGIFLTYVGILRYLGFFKSYNVLILTLKVSFPHVIRFLVCAVCLYAGFMFCGWVVFSPYHIKFRKLSTTSECLYSLVNGDDMFVTFSALTNNSDAIWYFHRAYLYIFISIFIYVVLSVFIAVIMDNYENLKHYYDSGWPDTEVQKFVKENGEMPISEIFSHVRRDRTWHDWFFCIFPCFGCLRSDHRISQMSRERQELLATI